MAACQLAENLEPNGSHVLKRNTKYTSNGILQPTVTVHDAKNVSIGSPSSCESGSTSNSRISPPGSTDASTASSPASNGGGLTSVRMEIKLRDEGGSSSPTSSSENSPRKGQNAFQIDLSALDSRVGKVREKFEEFSSNNNNLHFAGSPAGEKRRLKRRSVTRTNSSACNSISEHTEDTVTSDEHDSGSTSSSSTTNSPRQRPPLQRNIAIQDPIGGESPSFRCISPISGSPVEELETCSGVKTVVRRPPKGQSRQSSPSWRWSVMGVASGDYDAVTRATHNGSKHLNHQLTSTPTSSASTLNGHRALSRRSSLGLSAGTPPSTSVISPRTKRLSTEFRRLSLQMDMPWRDPNERLVKFADWLIARTEELMERGARARQKTYDLLRLAKRRQNDPIEF